MTAEIVVMNKNGVALAADSAVTMGQKIYQTSNKVFSLSKYYPIGVMVYNNSEFLGVPWEIIIKTYRKNLGNDQYDKIEDYSEDLLKFLTSNNELFSVDEELLNIKSLYTSLFLKIKNDIKNNVENYLSAVGPINDSILNKIINEVLSISIKKLEKIDFIGTIPNDFNILDDYYETIIEVKNEVFEKLPFTRGTLNKLYEICNLFIKKEIISENISSGMVIAGYGKNDYFPGLIHISIETRIKTLLKYKIGDAIKISHKMPAGVFAFAQKEMVSAFMEGMTKELFDFNRFYIKSIFDEYAQIIGNKFGKSQQSKKKIVTKFRKIHDNLINSYLNDMQKIKEDHYITPIIDAVSFLPKEELALMAETLVNLTLFRRKVSMDLETVGGPIDVALISKGDKFIWIKRKHYFQPEMNFQFFKIISCRGLNMKRVGKFKIQTMTEFNNFYFPHSIKKEEKKKQDIHFSAIELAKQNVKKVAKFL